MACTCDGSTVACTVGGTGTGEGNVISGNHGDGVNLVGWSVEDNRLLSNRIGVDATATAAIANDGDGVHLERAATARSVTVTPTTGTSSPATEATGIELYDQVRQRGHRGQRHRHQLPWDRAPRQRGGRRAPSRTGSHHNTVGSWNTIAFNGGAGVHVERHREPLQHHHPQQHHRQRRERASSWTDWGNGRAGTAPDRRRDARLRGRHRLPVLPRRAVHGLRRGGRDLRGRHRLPTRTAVGRSRPAARWRSCAPRRPTSTATPPSSRPAPTPTSRTTDRKTPSR